MRGAADASVAPPHDLGRARPGSRLEQGGAGLQQPPPALRGGARSAPPRPQLVDWQRAKVEAQRALDELLGGGGSSSLEHAPDTKEQRQQERLRRLNSDALAGGEWAPPAVSPPGDGLEGWAAALEEGDVPRHELSDDGGEAAEVTAAPAPSTHPSALPTAALAVFVEEVGAAVEHAQALLQQLRAALRAHPAQAAIAAAPRPGHRTRHTVIAAPPGYAQRAVTHVPRAQQAAAAASYVTAARVTKERAAQLHQQRAALAAAALQHLAPAAAPPPPPAAVTPQPTRSPAPARRRTEEEECVARSLQQLDARLAALGE